MLELYKRQTKCLVALDSIIFGFDGEKLKILLVKRGIEPSKNIWSLMGGWLKEKESLDQAASRIVKKLTTLKEIYLEQVASFGQHDRDPIERTVSICYFALISTDDYPQAKNQEYEAKWFDLKSMPPLLFDHEKMVKSAIEKLRNKAAFHPVGFELLPEKFTIPELQKLYEAIFSTNFDRRNFSRKMMASGFIVKLDEKQKGVSKKGAYYYRLKQDHKHFKSSLLPHVELFL